MEIVDYRLIPNTPVADTINAWLKQNGYCKYYFLNYMEKYPRANPLVVLDIVKNSINPENMINFKFCAHCGKEGNIITLIDSLPINFCCIDCIKKMET